MAEQEPIYLLKAVESVEGAATEYLSHRYNNCANRAYYACFGAAVHALERARFSSGWYPEYLGS